MEYQFNLLKIFDAILKNMRYFIMVGILSLLLSMLIISDDRPDVYAATSTIYSASYESYTDSVQGMNIMRDYADVINSQKVAERAASYLLQTVSTEQIQSMISSNYSTDSNIVTVVAQSTDSALATSVVNAVADAFIQEINSITTQDNIQVLDSATTARMVSQGALQTWMYRLGLTIGAVAILFMVVVVMAAIDTRVCFPSEVTLDGKIELLGIIPNKNNI